MSDYCSQFRADLDCLNWLLQGIVSMDRMLKPILKSLP
jgi:hypothetical protein